MMHHVFVYKFTAWNTIMCGRQIEENMNNSLFFLFLQFVFNT